MIHQSHLCCKLAESCGQGRPSRNTTGRARRADWEDPRRSSPEQHHYKTIYTWMLRFFRNVSHCYQVVGLMQTRLEVGPRTSSPQCSHPSWSETGKGRGKLSRKARLKAQRSAARPLNEMYLSLLYSLTFPHSSALVALSPPRQLLQGRQKPCKKTISKGHVPARLLRHTPCRPPTALPEPLLTQGGWQMATI